MSLWYREIVEHSCLLSKIVVYSWLIQWYIRYSLKENETERVTEAHVILTEPLGSVPFCSHKWASSDNEWPDKDLAVELKESLKHLFQQLYSLFKAFRFSGSAELSGMVYGNKLPCEVRIKFCCSYSRKIFKLSSSLHFQKKGWAKEQGSGGRI